MGKRSQKEKAEALLSLHLDGGLLVLPNIWDPIGARILEAKGYPAVATASAAVSASLGYQDGEKINILGGPTAAPLSVLREIGINRVSFGPFVFRSCLRKFVDIVEGLSANGDYASLGNLMSREEVSEFLRSEHE
jgi:2-methylisocitrate lyase-like PEP mutase family enzyme